MLNAITNEFKLKVAYALLTARGNYSGSDAAFAKQWDINNAVFSQIKNGKDLDGLLRDTQWLSIGRELNVTLKERQWKVARTEVYSIIEEDVKFCKANAKSMMFVDACGIGKTFTAKHLARTLSNCFYIDASQCTSKIEFVRALAKVIGLDNTGRLSEIKANIKYYLGMLPNPIIIIDEAGDLDYPAWLWLKSLWNATEGFCAYYMLGADGLKEKFIKGIHSKKVGYAELFSRFSERYSCAVPIGKEERDLFYRQLITEVLSANMTNTKSLDKIVKKCMIKGEGGLRRAEALVILAEQETLTREN